MHRSRRHPNHYSINNKGRNGLNHEGRMSQGDLSFKPQRSPLPSRNDFDEPEEIDLITNLTNI